MALLWGVLETEGEFEEEPEGFGIWDPRVLHLPGFPALLCAGFWLFRKRFPSFPISKSRVDGGEIHEFPAGNGGYSMGDFRGSEQGSVPALPSPIPTFLVWDSLGLLHGKWVCVFPGRRKSPLLTTASPD